MTSLLLRNVRPLGAAAVDVLVEGDRIAAIGPSLPAPASTVIENGHNALLLPGLIEGHTHLDKTVWGGPWYRNEVGPERMDRINNERAWRTTAQHDAATRARGLARDYLANGTTRLRTHVDIDPDIGLRHIHALLQIRAEFAGLIDMQIVAFPQSGVVRCPGVADLMDTALTEGADVIGGIDPCAIDRDPVCQLDLLFNLAQHHAKPIDIHLHEPGEMGAFSLDLILERTEALGLHGQVVISHGFCLGTIDTRARDALLARMAKLDMRIATTAPASTPVPSLAACRAADVTIFGGNDGIRDTWTPYARPDMLDRAMHIGLRNALRRDDELIWALDCVTDAAARGCGFAEYGLAPGCRADLVLMQAETLTEAIVAGSPRTLVVASGRVVARDNALLTEF
ncbi:MAG TPA: amidohydrolase family protein [Acetobacteraceae bacterium]|jgi:cytosine deaminase|nr:amidohydrolase family protein [Acetobacteraceae bacterium]